MLAFTERDIRARDVAAEILGGPAKLGLAGGDGQMRVTGSGTVGLVALRREYGNPFLDRVSGSIDWSLNVDVLSPGTLGWVFASSMKGAAIDLPAPLGKVAGEEMPLRIEGRDETSPPGTDFIVASYGRVAQFAAHRKQEGAKATIDRALLSLGQAVGRPDAMRADRPGLWLRAELPAFNADEWIPLLPRETDSGSGRQDAVPALAGADFDIHQFDAMGARFTDLRVSMRETPRGWTFDLNGAEIAGTATWSVPGAGAPNGRLVARLARIAIPGRGAVPSWRSAEGKESQTEPRLDSAGANPWPEIDLAADALVSKDRDLGQLEFVAQPRGAEWQIDRLKLVNESGRLDAVERGGWSAGSSRRSSTSRSMPRNPARSCALRVSRKRCKGRPRRSTASFPGRGRHTNSITRPSPECSASASGRAGSPSSSQVPASCSACFHCRRCHGALRSTTAMFFSEGFAFDEITGNVRIAGGLMTTSDLRLVGWSANVDISGETDLAKETQRLQVRVQPALSSSVSAGAALLFLANPLVGAAVGAGSLFAQTLLQDPFEKMFRFEYTVTGGWSDPVVTKTVGGSASAAPAKGACQQPERRHDEDRRTRARGHGADRFRR